MTCKALRHPGVSIGVISRNSEQSLKRSVAVIWSSRLCANVRMGCGRVDT
jgi:hypothetical protein